MFIKPVWEGTHTGFKNIFKNNNIILGFSF